MSEALGRLAAMAGIEASYIALTGETVIASDAAKRATLHAMGIAAGDDDDDRGEHRRTDAGRARLHAGAGGDIAASCPTG